MDAARAQDVPETRWQRLACGVNLAHWFAQAEPSRAAVERRYPDDSNFTMIQQAGFRHVRLSVNPELLFAPASPGKLRHDIFSLLENTIARLTSQKLAVIVDIHPEPGFQKQVQSEPEFAKSFAACWRELAARLAGTDPEMVFLEVMNEPSLPEAEQWNPIQQTLLEAMRAGAPRHTLIASANLRATEKNWDSVEALTRLQISPDKNVVYNFHYYAPMAFTHQGATWGWEATRDFKNIPYPSSPEAVAPLLAAIPEKSRGYVEWYGRERWNAEKIRADFARAAAWAREHGVRVTCNEFGVYKKFAPREARLAWLRDIAGALDDLGIGWTYWEYDGGFGFTEDAGGKRELDADVLAAFGLKNSGTMRPGF